MFKKIRQASHELNDSMKESVSINKKLYGDTLAKDDPKRLEIEAFAQESKQMLALLKTQFQHSEMPRSSRRFIKKAFREFWLTYYLKPNYAIIEATWQSLPALTRQRQVTFDNLSNGMAELDTDAKAAGHDTDA